MRPPPTMLHRNSINAEIRHVFRANGYESHLPQVHFVDDLPGTGDPDAVACAKPKQFAIFLKRTAYLALTPYQRRLTVAHEAVHLIPGSVDWDRQGRGEVHGERFRRMLENAGYDAFEDLGAWDAESLRGLEEFAVRQQTLASARHREDGHP